MSLLSDLHDHQEKAVMANSNIDSIIKEIKEHIDDNPESTAMTRYNLNQYDIEYLRKEGLSVEGSEPHEDGDVPYYISWAKKYDY